MEAEAGLGSGIRGVFFAPDPFPSTARGPVKSPDRAPRGGRWGFDRAWAGQIPGSESADRSAGIRPRPDPGT